MRRLLSLLVFTFLISPAAANWTGKDATPSTITFYNPGVCTAVVCVPVAQLTDGTNQVALTTAGADAGSNTLTGVPTYDRLLGFNGTTWDRLQVDANKFLKITATSGALVDIGSQADAACGTDNGSCSLIALQKRGNQNLTTLNTTAGNPIAACSAAPCVTTVGNVGFDPSSGKGTPTSVAINVSTATTTQLVALSGSTVIYVTSFDVLAGGTGNITFEYGTGASCGTGTTALTGAYNLTAQAGIAKGDGAAMVLKVPAGNALCVLTSAAVQMSGSVSYQQF